jgi:transposase
MIPRGVEIFVGVEPVDLRWSFDRLSGIATDRVGRSARSGARPPSRARDDLSRPP